MQISSATSRLGRVDFLVLVGLLVALMDELSGGLFVQAIDRGDDIILHKGKIIMRGGRGKGNIILDPGHSGQASHHIPMMPMHFNPYAFYPMHNHHHHQHHEPHMMMSRPIYIEDHSAMHNHHQPEHHHEQHSQEYHHEEPVHHHEESQPHHYEPAQHHEAEHHHYEPQHHHGEMHHHEIQHHEPVHHYEHDGHEEHEGHEGGHTEGYEHHHPMMSMHGSGPQPIYQQQQMAALHAPAMYAQFTPEQQVALYQHHQAMASQQQQQQQQQETAGQQQQNELQQGLGSNEVISQVSASDNSGSTPATPTTPKPVSKVSALLQKSAANNPLVQIIKPLFKRNKDQKESDKQKKP